MALQAKQVLPLGSNGTGLVRALLSAPLQEPTLTLPFQRSIGVIETGEAMFNVVDLRSGVCQRYQLTAPEIQGVTRGTRTENSVEQIVFAASVDHASGTS